jgi:hypothetical protein
VDRTRVIPSLYGYGVCLIAVLVFLVASVAFVNNAFRVVNPALGVHHRQVAQHGFRRPGRFGNYGVTPGNAGPRLATPSRTDRVQLGRLNAVRGVTLDIVLIIIAAMLFRGHWRWLGNNPSS